MKTPTLLALAALFLATPPFADSASAQAAFELDPAPKIFLTDFTWYDGNTTSRGRPNPRSLACTRSQPRRAAGEITSADYLSSAGYYAEKYRRFQSRGVDGIAFLVTDRLSGSFDGENAVAAAGWAAEAGLDFFAYYDLFVASGRVSNMVLCFPGSPCRKQPGPRAVFDYNLNTRPQLYTQVRDAFVEIGERLAAPHLNPAPGQGGYAFLETATGERVLDEQGLPRPLLALFIARELSDQPGNLAKIGELLDEVTDAYRTLGLGKPALVLDVIFWATPTYEADLERAYDPEIVAAFGDHAVAITWYGFFDTYRAGRFNIANDGPRPPMEVWAKKLHQRYQESLAELEGDGFELMLWPGIQTQIDTRVAPGCSQQGKPEVVYHLRSAEDWRTMLDRGYRNAFRPASGTPLQTTVIVANAGEWFETGGLDYTATDARGRCSFPYHWCTSLLDVLEEEDRYP